MSLKPFRNRRAHYRRVLSRAAPLEVYRRLYQADPEGFLYESLEAHGGRGRYSFLGGHSMATFEMQGSEGELRVGQERHPLRGNPIELLRELVMDGVDTLPVATFAGGAVGCFSYDIVRHVAPLGERPHDDLGWPDAYFMFPEDILIFDHRDEVVHMIHFSEQATAPRLDAIAAVVAECEHLAEKRPPADEEIGPVDADSLLANMEPQQFRDMVRRGKQHIIDGDLLQIVLSQRFEFARTQPPLSYFEALRATNPSPYMYFLNMGPRQIAGSSPEILVQRSGRRVVSRPLAGTRPRGGSESEDRALAVELLADPKERAEHLMLIDLARNDLGRVARIGSIHIDDSFSIERYKRVMHIVSQVSGSMRDDCDAFDLFAAGFPAGTVSGAPKVRAMQLIDQLEPTGRGAYAGAIGYFSFSGDADLCIGIRSLMFDRQRGFIQAGAGIVADSDPQREYEETLNKARGMVRAIRLAERTATKPVS